MKNDNIRKASGLLDAIQMNNDLLKRIARLTALREVREMVSRTANTFAKMERKDATKIAVGALRGTVDNIDALIAKEEKPKMKCQE